MPRIDREKLEAFKLYRPEVPVGAAPFAELDAPPEVITGEITFFVDGVEGADSFTATPSPVQDVGRIARLIEAPSARDRSPGFGPAAFRALLEATLARHGEYFQPPRLEPSTPFERCNILGQRTTQLIEEARALADALFADDLESRDEAYSAANACVFALLARAGASGGVERAKASGHDAALIHAWEHRLEELKQVDLEQLTPDQVVEHARECQQIRRELDAIFRDRFLYDNDAMLETNAEESVGMCLIEPRTQQRVSETRDSAERGAPAFELITVEVEGEARSVYFDREREAYYFDRTSDVVPSDLETRLVRTPIPDAEAALLTFRRPLANEHLRRNLRYDWTGDGYVQSSVVEWVGWAGHCSDKTNVETLLVPRTAAGQFEYPSAIAGVARFDPRLLDEAEMASVDAGCAAWSAPMASREFFVRALRSVHRSAAEARKRGAGDGIRGATAFEPGLATAVSGRLTPDLVSNLLDIVCAAYDARPYVLMYQGVRYFFETKEAWEAERVRLGRMRAAIYGAALLPDAGETETDTLLAHTGRVRRGENQQLEVTAQADGPLSFKLETREGDANLFVKLGGPASNQNYTRKADALGLSPDEVTLEARTGDRVHIAVYAACEDSDYTLEVRGPRPTASKRARDASEARSVAERHGEGRPDSLRPGTQGASEARSVAERHGEGRPDSLRPGTRGASEARSVAERHGEGRPDSLRPGTQ